MLLTLKVRKVSRRRSTKMERKRTQVDMFASKMLIFPDRSSSSCIIQIVFIHFTRAHSHAPSIRSHRGKKVVWPDFQLMRVSEEPVCIYLLRQNPVFTSLHPFMSYHLRGFQRDFIYLCRPIAPSYTSPNAGGWGGGGGCGVSANEYSCAHHVTWSPNKLWRSTSIFTLCILLYN